LNRFQAIFGFGNNFKFWPHLVQPSAKLIAHQPLIVCNDSSGGFDWQTVHQQQA
jgi:hypothetical protein